MNNIQHIMYYRNVFTCAKLALSLSLSLSRSLSLSLSLYIYIYNIIFVFVVCVGRRGGDGRREGGNFQRDGDGVAGCAGQDIYIYIYIYIYIERERERERSFHNSFRGVPLYSVTR